MRFQGVIWLIVTLMLRLRCAQHDDLMLLTGNFCGRTWGGSEPHARQRKCPLHRHLPVATMNCRNGILTGMGDILKRRLKQSKFQGPEQEAILNLMVTASYVEDIFTKACLEHGISHQQYNILRILRGVYPEGHPCGEIADRMLSRAPDITRRLDRLVRLGLVQRDRLADDRRVVITRITEAGLELLKEMDDKVQKGHEVLSRRLTSEECLEISRLCEKIYGEAP